MTDPNSLAPPQQPQPELDRALLNDVMSRALTPGTLFGRGLDLSERDREQFSVVVGLAENKLAPNYEDPEWQAFQALVQEGSDKGVLMSFASQEGSNVPSWCVNGGESATVKKIRLADSGTPAIEVPAKIFNLFHWQITTESLSKYITSSNDTLKGRMTKYLGQDLQQLSQLLKEPDSN